MENEQQMSRQIELGPERLRELFIDYLDRIYCAKQHMIDRFPAIAGQAHFLDLNQAILETVEDVKNQVVRMDEIYARLNVKSSLTGCAGLAGMIEEAFNAINEQKDDVYLRDMCILFYLQNMESVEVSSFRVLKMMAEKINDGQITQLLLENLDESKEDRALLLMITEKYVKS